MKDNNRYIKNGEKWTEGRITRIINNPIYSGDLLWGIYNRNEQNQILIPNHSPAIISKELWNKCQSQKDWLSDFQIRSRRRADRRRYKRGSGI